MSYSIAALPVSLALRIVYEEHDERD
jgi:hypothetical protein